MSSKLKEIPTSELIRNPLNPRMEFDPTTLEALKKSIAKVGILVPLTVYQRTVDGKYCLVDGERRWRCAQALGLKTVPAVIIPEPDKKTNLLQMFSIHHLRVQWKLIWTALKLETLMLMMETTDEEELSSYTGMTRRKIDHCKRILHFPKKYQEILLLPEKDETLTPDFFVELYPVLKRVQNELPSIYTRFSEEQIIDSLIQKFRKGQISAAREFRILKKVVAGVRRKTIPDYRAVDLFGKLITDPDMDIKQISRILMLETPNIRELTQACEALTSSLSTVPHEKIEEDRKLKDAIVKLRREVDRLPLEKPGLSDKGRRHS